MTRIVFLFLAACFVLGVIMIWRSMPGRRAGASCPQCGAANRRAAKYCASCGKRFE